MNCIIEETERKRESDSMRLAKIFSQFDENSTGVIELHQFTALVQSLDSSIQETAAVHLFR